MAKRVINFLIDNDDHYHDDVLMDDMSLNVNQESSSHGKFLLLS